MLALGRKYEILFNSDVVVNNVLVGFTKGRMGITIHEPFGWPQPLMKSMLMRYTTMTIIYPHYSAIFSLKQ
jgi:hypothetical protein